MKLSSACLHVLHQLSGTLTPRYDISDKQYDYTQSRPHTLNIYTRNPTSTGNRNLHI